MGSEEARNHGLYCGNKLPPVSSIDFVQVCRSSDGVCVVVSMCVPVVVVNPNNGDVAAI